jgi:hypothetical protein
VINGYTFQLISVAACISAVFDLPFVSYMQTSDDRCIWISRNNQQDANCNRTYYSNVYWRLNMFRAAHCSSPGALNCICSLWFTYTCGDWPLLSSGHFPFTCIRIHEHICIKNISRLKNVTTNV